MRSPMAVAQALLLVLVLTLAPASARDLDAVRAAGELRIGVSLFTPWAMLRSDGSLAGFEPEVAARAALDLGVVPVFHVLDWDELIPALRADRIDAIVAGMTITPERMGQVAFTRPYGRSEIRAVINSRTLKGADTLAYLDAEGVRIGVVRDTVSDALVAGRLPRANRVPFFDVGRLHDALARDELDAYVGSEPGPRLVVSRHPGVLRELPGPPLRVTEQAMAVAPGSRALLRWLDAWIDQRARDGWLGEVRGYWFEGLEWLE